MGRAIAWVLLLGLVSGCGRIGYDVVSATDGPPVDAAVDMAGPGDAAVDAPRPDATADAPRPDATADVPRPDAPADAPGVDLSPDRAADAAACFMGWTVEPVGGHCYQILTNASSWDNARVGCLAFGGHLVTISSASEQAFVRDFRQRQGVDLWLGLSRAGTGPFRWVTGEPLGFTAWDFGMPDEPRDGFVRITPFGWDDSAGGSYAVLCEYEP